MTVDRSEYPALLASLTPAQAVDVLNHRVDSIQHLNTDIADWLGERRKLEEQYAAGLYKLGRRPAVSDPNELGVFSTPWSSIVSSVITLADSHRTLAEKIEQDVEKPLRDFKHKNRDMHAMTTIQGNCNAMARDLEKTHKTADKLEHKGSRASTGRVANVSRDMETAQSQWDSQAPYVFETLQALDETRLNHLRDVLTQMQTHETDQIERNRIAAEQCLNTLLTVETADEIKTFSLRTLQNKDAIPSSRARGSVSGPSAVAPPTAIAGSSAADDRASQRSDSISDLPTKSEKPRGLKRLGTVLSRRRQSHVPTGADRISESPERKSPERMGRLQSTSTFGSFSNRFGKSKGDAPSLEPPREEQERPRSPLRTASSINDSNGQDWPDVATPGPTETPATNGNASAADGGYKNNDLAGLSLQEPLQPSAPTAAREITKEPARDPMSVAPNVTDNEGYSQRPDTIDPITAAQMEASEERSQPQYNVNIKDAPVTQEAGDADALNTVANTLKMQAPPTAAARRLGTVRGRRENRASVYSGGAPQTAPLTQTISGPVSEEIVGGPVQEKTRELTPEPVSAGIVAPPPAASFAPINPIPANQQSTYSPFSPSTGSESRSAIGSAPSTNFLPPGPSSPLGLIRPGSNLGEDTGSIRSGRSLSSVASGSHRHADMVNPGLNASIIETVSVTWENGVATKGAVIGELALAHNTTDSSKTANNETIRLDNFDRLEKVAPNPAFLTQVDGKSGEYSLNLGHISRTQVAFKYQVGLPTSSFDTYAPLHVQPAWKIEPNQTSVIVTYGLHPAFEERGFPSLSLSNVTLVLYLGESGAKASSCLSKPVGTFAKERQCIYWQLGDVTLTAGSQQKMLARFITEGEAVKGRVEAKFEANGIDGSGLTVSAKGDAEDDPFQDEDAVAAAGTWKPVNAVKKLVSGTYQSL